MMRWSRPDILNSVRELSRYMTVAGEVCKKALFRTMNYVVATKSLGYTFKPDNPGSWDGRRGRGYKFKIMGKSDSEYAKHSSRRSVNAGITYLNGAIVKQFSKMMPVVALSTTEAELYACVLTAQDMLFVYNILVGMELEVELPMILYCGNKGTVDLANNWSVGGRTRHVDCRLNFLRELKGASPDGKGNPLLEVRWCSGKGLKPDTHTKNLPVNEFQKYRSELVS